MGKKVKAEPADESMDTTMKSEAPEEDNDESGGKAQKRPLPTPVTEKGWYRSNLVLLQSIALIPDWWGWN